MSALFTNRRIWLLTALAVLGSLAIWYFYGKGRSAEVERTIPTEAVEICRGLDVPWQLAWLESGHILFTELGGAIKRVDISTGTVDALYHQANLAREIQAGLMGLALSTSFGVDSMVYVSYSYYRQDTLFLAVDRLQFRGDKLVHDQVLIADIPSFSISLGGRLLVHDDHLFLTVGEGASSEGVQARDNLQGKVLRYRLDGTIPPDNPIPGSPVWSLGFRNPQGICQGPGGLYATDHGTFSNDEINQLTKGSNHGWPVQAGFCEGDCDTADYQDPMTSWTPTVAPSGVAYCPQSAIPGISNALLVACLKGQMLKVLTLGADGRSIAEETDILQNRVGRIRDVLVTPEGRIFVATSNEDVYGLGREHGDVIAEVVKGDSAAVVKIEPPQPPSMITLDSTNIRVSTIAEGLRLPWELVLVGSHHLWFNERGGAIKRLDLRSGEVRLIHQLSDVYQSNDNSGMHGFTVHPDFPAKPFLYGHYTYELYKSRLVRLQVDTWRWSVSQMDTLLAELEANKSHNGSRLTFGPDGKLYFCIGDGYKRRAAQKLNRYNGKILRLNEDGSVPDDNPISGSHIWTWGHRNPQGLAWGSNGRLYSTEHGSSNDDEVNLILGNRNYGFPNVQGPCDERSEQRFCEQNQVVEPMKTWTPTIGPAGIDYYGSTAIPEWTHSLLVTTLKSGRGEVGQRLVRCALNADGTEIVHTEDFLTYSFGRLRDVLAAPDGRIFLCTSNQESNQNAREVVQAVDDRIIELRAVRAPTGRPDAE